MAVHFLFASDLEVPIFQAIQEGRICLYGKQCRKRILHFGKRGGLYINNRGGKKYLSPTTNVKVVITNAMEAKSAKRK